MCCIETFISYNLLVEIARVFAVNPNRGHNYTPLSESSSTTKETLDVHLNCLNAHHKVTSVQE